MEEIKRDAFVRDLNSLQNDSNQQSDMEQDESSKDESVYTGKIQLKFLAVAKTTLECHYSMTLTFLHVLLYFHCELRLQKVCRSQKTFVNDFFLIKSNVLMCAPGTSMLL